MNLENLSVDVKGLSIEELKKRVKALNNAIGKDTSKLDKEIHQLALDVFKSRLAELKEANNIFETIVNEVTEKRIKFGKIGKEKTSISYTFKNDTEKDFIINSDVEKEFNKRLKGNWCYDIGIYDIYVIYSEE